VLERGYNRLGLAVAAATLCAAALAAWGVPGARAATPPPDDSQPLPTLAAVSSTSHVDPRMSAAASRLAGKPATVRCLSAGDWATLAGQVGGGPFGSSYSTSGAYTTFVSGRISVSPNECGLVAKFTYRRYFPVDRARQFDLAQAFAIVAHEAGNVSLGHRDDAAAECRGEQWIAPLAKLLRPTVKPANARLLATLMWRYGYPQLPASYRSPDCRDGGPLDLNAASSVWP
jgi:hypothetical protein